MFLLRRISALVVTLASLQAGVAAQERPAVSVQSISVDGKPVKTVDGVR
jgi:hypothetical protein